tara:strand:- start:227 stop:1171 length:945 start_codon:yes stop_codon:yes gene_type:complete
MAKPSYGGWVSFTAHLALKYGYTLYKIGKRTELLKNGSPRLRKFGYGVFYQNISIEDAIELSNILITAIDKNYYHYLNKLSPKTTLVIHDPTEVKGKSCQPVIDVLDTFDIITIRTSVKEFIKTKYNITSKFKPHPFFEYPIKQSTKRTGCVSISRVDFDKHTEVTLKANKLLPKKLKIDIYGAKNDRYVYFKLKKEDLDFEKHYKGTFKKSFADLDAILGDKLFVIDLSVIKNDGGGSQYTFLEAIYQGCVLILNKQWLAAKGNIFEEGVNCLVVEDEYDIEKLLKKQHTMKTLSNIKNNAKLLLNPHISVSW